MRLVEKKKLILPIFQNSYVFYFEKLQHMQAIEQHMTFGRGGGVYVKMCLLLIVKMPKFGNIKSV